MRSTLVIILTMVLPLDVVLPNISIGANLAIKQEGFLFQPVLTENVYVETFVISSVPDKKKNAQEVAAQPKITPDSVDEASPLVVAFTNPITVFFQINSAEIGPSERSKLLSKLHELKVPQSVHLCVTGFTCQKGPAPFNHYLSNQRAKAVAQLLTKKGFTVTRIEGKGDADLVSKTYPPFNRRVEITPSKN